MNIEKLLKKLDKNAIETKKQLLTVQNAYKLKTSESIGTLNSLADQNEHSFVIGDAFTPHSKKFNVEGFSANSKLDEELSNIDKMKTLYQSRQNKNRVRAKSIQRGSASGQKSLQKHLLKPSNTPSFSKVQKAKPITQENDSACKNLYTDQMLDNSQISQLSQVSQNKTSHLKGSKKNYFQYPKSSIHVSEPEQQPYQEEPSYNQQSLSQIANISQDIHQDSTSKNAKKNQHNLQQTWQQDTNTNLKQNQSKKFESYRNASKCNCSCPYKQQIKILTSDLEEKMQRISSRLAEVQQENKRMKETQAQILHQNSQIRLAFAQLNEQKQKALLEAKNQQQQKQQLEILLKDVLYKRQREKLQSSKENTFRQNEKKMNNFSFVQTQSTNELKPRNSNSIGPQSRPSQSKMKVHNLLHKLQIRVDRN